VNAATETPVDFLAELILLAAEDDAAAAPVEAVALPKFAYVCLSCGSNLVSHNMTMPAHRRHAATHYGVCFYCDGGKAERRIALVKSA
jgi:hypothetical protein